jgi:hypothetical protein
MILILIMVMVSKMRMSNKSRRAPKRKMTMRMSNQVFRMRVVMGAMTNQMRKTSTKVRGPLLATRKNPKLKFKKLKRDRRTTETTFHLWICSQKSIL